MMTGPKKFVRPEDIISHFENDMTKIRRELEKDMENTLSEWRKKIAIQKSVAKLNTDEETETMSIPQSEKTENNEEEDDTVVAAPDDIIVGDTDESEGDVLDRLGPYDDMTLTNEKNEQEEDDIADSHRMKEEMSDITVSDDKLSSKGKKHCKISTEKKNKKKRKKKKKKHQNKVETDDMTESLSCPVDSSSMDDSLELEQLEKEHHKPASFLGHAKILVMQFALLAVVAGQLIFQFFI